MQQKIDENFMYLKPTEKEEIAKIKSIRMFKEDRKAGYWYGELSKTLLEKTKSAFGLIRPAQNKLDEFNRVQAAVDKMRNLPNDEVPDLVEYPVNANLFIHQRRAVNMALLTFGVLDPDIVLKGERK